MMTPTLPIRAILAGSVLAASGGEAASPDVSALYHTCFARTYSATHLAAHPGQRVSAIAVNFQVFGDDLLASVIYTLKYGTRFGFSGACYVKIDGGFQCEGCVTDNCETGGEKFKILWSGGDTVRLVNDSTGMLAKNVEGGRDYLAADGEHREFLLRRGSTDDCEW